MGVQPPSRLHYPTFSNAITQFLGGISNLMTRSSTEPQLARCTPPGFLRALSVPAVKALFQTRSDISRHNLPFSHHPPTTIFLKRTWEVIAAQGSRVLSAFIRVYRRQDSLCGKFRWQRTKSAMGSAAFQKLDTYVIHPGSCGLIAPAGAKRPINNRPQVGNLFRKVVSHRFSLAPSFEAGG
jgi:hypothetical protein